jgi:hypothetical protein
MGEISVLNSLVLPQDLQLPTCFALGDPHRPNGIDQCQVLTIRAESRAGQIALKEGSPEQFTCLSIPEAAGNEAVAYQSLAPVVPSSPRPGEAFKRSDLSLGRRIPDPEVVTVVRNNGEQTRGLPGDRVAPLVRQMDLLYLLAVGRVPDVDDVFLPPARC